MVSKSLLVDSLFLFSSIIVTDCFSATTHQSLRDIGGRHRQTSTSHPKISTTSLHHRREDSSNYLDILASNTPLLDVRAPVEFAKGSFPRTYNHPLLNDKQRELIGTCYKQKGQDAAISLGYSMVNETDNLKSDLVQSWKNHIDLYPNGYLYCFRGGLRSHLVQEWLEEAGIEYPLIIGGYKAMRSSLLLDLEESLKSIPFVLIGGRTCSGKTNALMELERYVDLEGLANHRGSAFGAIARDAQPSQIDFENSIIIECLKLRQSSSTLPVFMEDEGNRVGSRSLPHPMHSPMANDFPLLLLETPMEERIDICIHDYVQAPFLKFGGDVEAHARVREMNMSAVGRIQKALKKKLGDQRKRGDEIVDEFEMAFDEFESSKAIQITGFRKPVQTLLEYYDKMYDYQMDQRKGEILFRGNMAELIKFAKEYR